MLAYANTINKLKYSNQWKSILITMTMTNTISLIIIVKNSSPIMYLLE